MADMNCSAVTIKYLIFIFNLLFVLIGIIFISVGVSVKEYYSDYVAFLDNQYFSAPNFLIAIGSIIFFIAFLGCCGAIKQNFCMLTTFTGLLIVIFIFEFSAGIAGYVLRNQTEEYLETTLEASIDDYQPNSQSVNEVTYVWDLIQKDFECCGANSYEDWSKNPGLDANKSLPLSCCKIPHGASGDFQCNLANTTYVYKTGCVTAFGDFVSDHAVSIGGVAMGFAMLQIIAIIFAWYLTKQVRTISEYA